ncbi:hypothetical protein Y032_0435g1416 [Ancylostoma ceylanicum]|uniref:Uncharacterized protein n=1 Tax=Ancylostoma ceylanicum TaxID=53326 RepID=A0A016WZX6_9BILA|nr:hypothetical protein Y032_0435g1416 [Ancylostoma ceylanicum]
MRKNSRINDEKIRYEGYKYPKSRRTKEKKPKQKPDFNVDSRGQKKKMEANTIDNKDGGRTAATRAAMTQPDSGAQ